MGIYILHSANYEESVRIRGGWNEGAVCCYYPDRAISYGHVDGTRDAIEENRGRELESLVDWFAGRVQRGRGCAGRGKRAKVSPG